MSFLFFFILFKYRRVLNCMKCKSVNLVNGLAVSSDRHRLTADKSREPRERRKRLNLNPQL